MDRLNILWKHFPTAEAYSNQKSCLGLRPSETSARPTETGNPVLIGGIVMDVQVCECRMLCLMVTRNPSLAMLVQSTVVASQWCSGGGSVFKQIWTSTQAEPSSDADVTRGGSVPGKVQQTPGGVARNICECLALLCNSDLLPSSTR